MNNSTLDDDIVYFNVDNNNAKSDTPMLVTECSVPWLQNEVFDKKSPSLVRLHNEILTFCEYCALTQSEMIQRKTALKDICDAIISVYPQCTIAVFGSQMTKILTPTSDIDMVYT